MADRCEYESSPPAWLAGWRRWSWQGHGQKKLIAQLETLAEHLEDQRVELIGPGFHNVEFGFFFVNETIAVKNTVEVVSVCGKYSLPCLEGLG